ncbi:uncharacterized protein LOC115944828 isoform X2 [Leptonychotes weddellii]|uniref:Uncharacterized protein LOC115944828 isoform X2 n=1 Tax=Leptonychotes weddellii TaxID=9713 RepID=A0A7F8RUI9_LEPWE|nr:uncharacterized protein LOC115944828 isoform X2 [Leptonychotes weddellii]
MCVEAFRGAGQLPNSVGPWSAPPPSQRPTDSSLRPALGRRLVLRDGGAGKCLDLGSPKLRASPASPWPALPSGARPGPGLKRFVPGLGSRASPYALAVAGASLGRRRPSPGATAACVPCAARLGDQPPNFFPGRRQRSRRWPRWELARWAGWGEGESLPAAAAEAATVAEATVTEQVRRSQLPGKEPPPRTQRDPAGRGVHAPPWAEVLPSSFSGPGGTLCPISFRLELWLQQVKTQSGRWGPLECSPLSLSPSLAISLLSEQGCWGCTAQKLLAWRKASLVPALLSLQTLPLTTLARGHSGQNTSSPWTWPFLPAAHPVLTCPGGQQ